MPKNRYSRTQPQSRPPQISAKLQAFGDIQIKLVETAMNRMVISKTLATEPLTDEQKTLLHDVQRLTITLEAEKALRTSEQGFLHQIMAARKGKAYLAAIASLRSYTPVRDTPLTSESLADQRRRAIALQLLHQFMIAEAVPLSKILAVRLDDPEENPFMPTHKVEAFAKVIDRWALTFHLEPRPARRIHRVATPVATQADIKTGSQSEVAAVVAHTRPEPKPTEEPEVSTSSEGEERVPPRLSNGRFTSTTTKEPGAPKPPSTRKSN